MDMKVSWDDSQLNGKMFQITKQCINLERFPKTETGNHASFLPKNFHDSGLLKHFITMKEG